MYLLFLFIVDKHVGQNVLSLPPSIAYTYSNLPMNNPLVYVKSPYLGNHGSFSKNKPLTNIKLFLSIGRRPNPKELLF